MVPTRGTFLIGGVDARSPRSKLSVTALTSPASDNQDQPLFPFGGKPNQRSGNKAGCAFVRFRIRVNPCAVIVTVITLMSVGLVTYALLFGTPLHYEDEKDYVEIATNLHQGHGFALGGSPTAFRPPAWPVVLAAFLSLGMPAHLLSVVSAAAMIAASVVAAVLGVKLCRNAWGGLAGIVVLAYPLNIYTAVRLYPQAFATLLVLALWLIAFIVVDNWRTSDAPNAVTYASLGGVSSILTLSVPTLAVTGLAVVAWVALTAGGDRIRATMYSGIAFVVPIAAWMLRNYRVLGTPVPVSTSDGYNLLIGNNATATGSSGVAVDIKGPIQNASALNEVDRDSYLRKTALDWITQHPLASIELYAQKVLNYFSPYNQPVTTSEGNSGFRWISYVSFGVLVSLVIARLLLRRYLPLHRTERVFNALFLFNALVMAVFFTRTRFRQPLDNVLVVEAAIGVVILFTVANTWHRARNTESAIHTHET